MNAWKLTKTSMFSCGHAGHSAGLFIQGGPSQVPATWGMLLSVCPAATYLPFSPAQCSQMSAANCLFLASFYWKINELAHMQFHLIYKYSFKVLVLVLEVYAKQPHVQLLRSFVPISGHFYICDMH